MRAHFPFDHTGDCLSEASQLESVSNGTARNNRKRLQKKSRTSRITRFRPSGDFFKYCCHSFPLRTKILLLCDRRSPSALKGRLEVRRLERDEGNNIDTKLGHYPDFFLPGGGGCSDHLSGNDDAEASQAGSKTFSS